MGNKLQEIFKFTAVHTIFNLGFGIIGVLFYAYSYTQFASCSQDLGAMLLACGIVNLILFLIDIALAFAVSASSKRNPVTGVETESKIATILGWLLMALWFAGEITSFVLWIVGSARVWQMDAAGAFPSATCVATTLYANTHFFMMAGWIGSFSFFFIGGMIWIILGGWKITESAAATESRLKAEADFSRIAVEEASKVHAEEATHA